MHSLDIISGKDFIVDETVLNIMKIYKQSKTSNIELGDL